VASLTGDRKQGGKDGLRNYVVENVPVIKTRPPTAPVVVVFDRDAANKAKDLKSKFATKDPIHILAWPSDTINPHLGESFTGIEGHLSDRLISLAKGRGALIGQLDDGKMIVEARNYGRVKGIINEVICEDLIEDDLVYCKRFLLEVVKLISERKPPSNT
jgi:hypothetical protein